MLMNGFNFPSLHNGQNLVHSERKRFNILLAGRRWRKTTYAAMYLFRHAAKYGGEYLWGAPTHDQNKIALGYMEKFGNGKVYINRSSMELRLKNGSLIRFRSLHKPDNARGFTVNGVVIDEAAFTNSECYIEVLRPTLMDTKGWSLLISTPNSFNWIYDIYSKGDTEETKVWCIPSYGVFIKDSKRIERDANRYENPNLDLHEIQSLYDTMDSYSFRQEILCEFLADQLNPFINIDNLCSLPSLSGSSVSTVAGLDFAKENDYSCISIVSPIDKREVFISRLPHANYTFQLEYVAEYIRKYNVSAICFDATGVGVKLAEDMYAKFGGHVRLIPFTFTSDSKPKLIMDLILAFEKEKMYWTNDHIAREELRKFGRKVKGNSVDFSAISGNDDTVIARALAYHISNNKGIFL